MRAGGIVLAGGRSTRMGRDKASLVWRGRPLLLHVLEALAAGLPHAGAGSAAPLVVVRTPGQELPPLPSGAEVVEDAVAARGPLQGLRDGLAALAGRADVAVVASTDLPLLQPSLVRLLLGLVGEAVDAAVPVVGGRRHPLCAAYRTSLVPVVDELLAAGERRARALYDHCGSRAVDEATLRTADPELRSLRNVNAAADLDALG